MNAWERGEAAGPRTGTSAGDTTGKDLAVHTSPGGSFRKISFLGEERSLGGGAGKGSKCLR